MIIKLLFILLSFLIFYTNAYADFYKWEDESGATHISDYPPPQTKDTKNYEVHKGDTDNSVATDEEKEAAKTKKKPEVILYTKNDCADCDKAREFLKSKNITFVEYNMDRDRTAAEKRKEFDDGTDVPFAVINRINITGFSETVYNRALKPNP